MELYPHFKMEYLLWKSDIHVRDKQNVDAATEILRPKVCFCLKNWNEKISIAKRVYLKLGEIIYAAFTEKKNICSAKGKACRAPYNFLPPLDG